MRSRLLACLAPLTLCGVIVVSCGGGDESASNASNTGGGGAGGSGANGGTAGSQDGGIDAHGGFSGDGSTDGSTTITCAEPCPDGTECNNGVCLPPQGPCTSDRDCAYDTYCNATGDCVPYATPPDDFTFDPGCKQLIPPESFAPEIQCEFMEAPAGDAFPGFLEVRVTPMVVNFEPGGKTGASIVVPFASAYNDLPSGASCTYEDCHYRYGIIRVLSGADCSLEANIGGEDIDPTPNGKREWARSSSPVALGDLDGDGISEIVAFMVEEHEGDEVLVAYTRKSGAWAPLWPTAKAVNADGTVFNATIPVSGASGSGWAAPSIHDLDNDGVPEIIREGWVVNGATGVVRANPPTAYASYSVGIPPVLANLDGDANIEMTNGANVWEFDGAGNVWTEDATYAQGGTSAPGWAAVADFDPYDGAATPEIAVASTSTMTIYKTDHTVFMSMAVSVPSGGGGPPTIADYDGDNLPEVGVAGADYYTVYDPDCQASPRPGGKCDSRDRCDFDPAGACPDYILWSRTSQDHSSRITGSSVFDFEADGKAEVVYADECFARVYSGSDGKVVFSQYRSSSTWLENPVVADIDGDYRSELIVPSNGGGTFDAQYCAGLLNADGVETHFAGLICDKNEDCLSGSCDQGLCRCTSSAECCALGDDAQCIEFGYKCAAPPAGTAGTGNTCRASYPHGLSGLRVYRDSRDRWVRSRSIWNQHAYAVTHVNEDGTIPKTSAWANNWSMVGLNNFRQNVPGEADGTDIGDLTAQVGNGFVCAGSAAVLKSPVCNRGTAPVGAGIEVGFYSGSELVCSTTTEQPIEVGECIVVTCTWATPPSVESSAVNVTVVPNDGAALSECVMENNEGMILDVFCKGAA